MAKAPTVPDWEAVVFQHRASGIANGVRVLLLYLARNMRSDLVVSVPRSRIARDLGISEPQVTKRIKAAKDAGFLDDLVIARPRVTAVYKATFPNLAPKSGVTTGVPQRFNSPYPSRGNHVGTPDTPFRGTHVGSANSEHVEPGVPGCNSPRGHEGFTGSASAAAPLEESLTPDPGTTHEVRRRGTERVTHEVRHRETPNREDQTSPMRRESEAERPAGSRETAKRRAILDEIQRCAGDDTYVSEDLADLLNDHEDGLGDYAINYWTIKKEAATDRYEAGRQLNMLIATYRSAA